MDESSKHTRKGRAEVDEHEGADEEKQQKGETKLTNTEKQRRGRQQVKKSKGTEENRGTRDKVHAYE